MTKKLNILLIIFVLLVFGLLVVFVFDINCLFKTIFHIPCPGCGLTRAFKLIFHGHIIESFKYNILAVPILVFLLVLIILLVYDFIKKTNTVDKYLNFFVKYYIYVLVLLLISFIINVFRGI